MIIGFPFYGVCRNCRAGQPRYCEQGGALMFSGHRLDGSSPLKRENGEALARRFFQQSSWATHTVTQEQQLAVVPDGVDHDLMGPLGCSISTGAGTVLNELRPGPGSSIAILGAGAVGLSAVMAARLTGATRIIAVDKVPGRLALARELGATEVVEGGADAASAVKELTGGGADYSVEATSGANLVAAAVAALTKLGTCAMVGGGRPMDQVRLNHPDMLQQGKTLNGVMGGGGQTPAFLQALMRLQAQERFPVEMLVRRYDFADINHAIDDSDAGTAVKPLCICRKGRIGCPKTSTSLGLLHAA